MSLVLSYLKMALFLVLSIIMPPNTYGLELYIRDIDEMRGIGKFLILFHASLSIQQYQQSSKISKLPSTSLVPPPNTQILLFIFWQEKLYLGVVMLANFLTYFVRLSYIKARLETYERESSQIPPKIMYLKRQILTPPALAYNFKDKGTAQMREEGIDTFIYRIKGSYVVPNIKIISSFQSNSYLSSFCIYYCTFKLVYDIVSTSKVSVLNCSASFKSTIYDSFLFKSQIYNRSFSEPPNMNICYQKIKDLCRVFSYFKLLCAFIDIFLRLRVETEEVGPQLVFPPNIVIQLGPDGNRKALQMPLFKEKFKISHLCYFSFNFYIIQDRQNVPVYPPITYNSFLHLITQQVHRFTFNFGKTIHQSLENEYFSQKLRIASSSYPKNLPPITQTCQL